MPVTDTPIQHIESYKMINEAEGEEIFKSPEELRETLMILAEKGLISEVIEKAHCQKYDRDVKACPDARLHGPYSPDDRNYIRIMKDSPKLHFDPMFDITCRNNNCPLYGRMIRKIIDIRENYE